MLGIPKIILSRPKIVFDTKCNKCKSFDIVAAPLLKVRCKNCSSETDVEPTVSIYFSIAKKLLQTLSWHNEIWVLGERDASEVFHADDLLKPRSKNEDDIWHTMLAIQKDFNNQKCWEVDEIIQANDTDYKTFCLSCGYCKNCSTCLRCTKKYVPRVVKTNAGEEKRYTCPSCNSKSYEDTKVSKFIIVDEKNACPDCKSTDVALTAFRSEKKVCPRCKSPNLKVPRSIPVYKLVIRRQKRFCL